MTTHFSKKRILNILFGTQKVLGLLPGTILSLVVMLVSMLVAHYLGLFIQNQFSLSKTLVSMFLLAIILGMAVRNTIKIHPAFDPGIQFCLARLLRLGIIFLGIRLSLLAVAKIGLVSFFIAVICVLSGMIAASYLARLFRVESRLGTLIAAGTSICGVSAIVAVSPCIAAREEETTYAISTITIFGLMVTLAYPYLAELVFHFNLAQTGIFLGTSIHETAQVTGAAYIYDQLWQTEVSQIAITTKLVRNMLMVAVIPILALVYAKKTTSCQLDGTPVKGYWQYFPKFILGFLAFALFRSLGDWFITARQGSFLFWSTPETWSSFYLFIKSSAKYILAVSITAAGLSTRFSKLKKLSYKPFLIGLAAAVVVGGISFLLVKSFSGPIQSLLTGT
jgi:uncharacterized integral membrane protein (TIGR00698 family)